VSTPVLHCVQCGRASAGQGSSARCEACGSPLIDLRSSTLDARQRAVADAILAAQLKRLDSRVVVIGALLGFAMPIAAYLTFPFALGAESAILALIGGICGGIAGKLAVPVVARLLGRRHPLAHVHSLRQLRLGAVAVVAFSLLGLGMVGGALYIAVQDAQQLRRQILIGASGGSQDATAAARLLEEVRVHKRDLSRCFVVDRDVINRLAAVHTSRMKVGKDGRVESLRPDTAMRCVTDVMRPALATLSHGLGGHEVQLQIVVRRPLFGDKPVLLLPNTVSFGS
jgi:hypothetical protein